MSLAIRTFTNLYRDSVALMKLSTQLAQRPGVVQAHAVMATPANRAMLEEAGLPVGEVQAGPNDVLLVVTGPDAHRLREIVEEGAELLERAAFVEADTNATGDIPLRSVQMGIDAQPTANLVLISTPGEYAAAEAYKALQLGLNVMIFSDNVTIEDEVALKHLAHSAGLLVMGPDCGTAIVDGVPLAFANVVRRGRIGVIGASGTGIQQITTLIDRLGAGISHALGTGGRDLHSAVGGISMLTALTDLAQDAATDVIVLVSKPPAAQIAARVLAAAAETGKPVVVCFLGAPTNEPRPPLYFAETLAAAAEVAVRLSGVEVSLHGSAAQGEPSPILSQTNQRLAPSQRYIRGLYSGGTFCYEALLLLEKSLGAVFSNVAKESDRRLSSDAPSQEHTVIDLGDDEFTRGRPHPMIDLRLRCERLLVEAADPSVAVIVMDVVLGYGAHPDPAAELAPAIVTARQIAADGGRHLAVVAFVCGTEGDPQQLARQETMLTGAGAILAASSTAAVHLTLTLLGQFTDQTERTSQT
jgi:FdrA protein